MMVKLCNMADRKDSQDFKGISEDGIICKEEFFMIFESVNPIYARCSSQLPIMVLEDEEKGENGIIYWASFLE